MSAYIYYMPKGGAGDVLRYWTAPHGKCRCRTTAGAICATTKKPVLAHLFLNYIIDNGVAYYELRQLHRLPAAAELDHAGRRSSRRA